MDRLDEIEAALDRGWALTPAIGKRPTRKNWQTEPPLTFDELAPHVRAGGNIALRTGSVSDVLVLDVDPHKSACVPEAVEEVETPSLRTGSGGLHLLFAPPPGQHVGNSAGKIAPGVDVRGDGGASIYAGSIHPITRRRYEWIISPDEAPLAAFPMHLFPKPKPPTARFARQGGVTSAYVKAALANELGGVRTAPQGTRNERLNRAAFALARLSAHIDAAFIEHALLDAALATGLPEHEARATIRSGLTGRRNAGTIYK